MERRLLLTLFLLVAACTPAVADLVEPTAPEAMSPEQDASVANTEGDQVEDGSLAGTTPAPEFPDGLDWLNTEQPLSIADLRGKLCDSGL